MYLFHIFREVDLVSTIGFPKRLLFMMSRDDSLESSSFLSDSSSSDLHNADIVEELENAVEDTNALNLDAIKRLLHQQKKGIFDRTIRWCSAVAFHLLISKEKGLKLAESRQSAEQSFKAWEESGTISCVLRSKIQNAMVVFVREIFSFGNKEDAEAYPKAKVDYSSASSTAVYDCLQQKDEDELIADMEQLFGGNFKEIFIHFYASNCWMSLVANLWGTSNPKLTEGERSLLDTTWGSAQVTPECRQQFIQFGAEAIISVLSEDCEPLSVRSTGETAELETLLLHNPHASLFPYEFSVEYTPNSRLSDSGQQWEVEEILARRFVGTDRRKDDNYEYLIKWKGYGSAWNSWESFRNLHCRELVVELKRKERLIRRSNMRLLQEESIFAETVGPMNASNEESFTNMLPMQLYFSNRENAQDSRSTL